MLTISVYVYVPDISVKSYILFQFKNIYVKNMINILGKRLDILKSRVRMSSDRNTSRYEKLYFRKKKKIRCIFIFYTHY